MRAFYLLVLCYAVGMMYSGPDIEIIYEDEALLAVNKPAGLVVHADGRTEEPTLTDWVLEKYPECGDVGGLHTLDNGRYAPRAGIVHRLDRDTSGVVLVAKTNEAFWPLQQQFLDRTIVKEYLALCAGVPKLSEGVIDFPIGRGRKDFRQWSTGADARGTLRTAITQYATVLSGVHDGRMFSLVRFMPKTGRTHQLRVHAKAAGFPIISDARYGIASALGMERHALHACKLTIVHPLTKQEVILTAPLSFDMEQSCKLLRNE